MEQTCPQLLTYHHVKMNSLETQPKLVAVPKMFAHFHSLPPWFLLPIFASLITVAMVFPGFFFVREHLLQEFIPKTMGFNVFQY